MKKHFFNMVEIALAMVVISLGITGILGLFSVGVNAKKAAINENNVADAAEYVLGVYKAFVCNKYESGESITLDSLGLKGALSNDDSATALNITDWDANKNSYFTLSGNTSAKKESGLYYKSSTTAIPQVFCYMAVRESETGNELVADTQLQGYVWAAKVPVTFAESTGVTSQGGSGTTSKNVELDYKYGVRVYLELSWPVDKPYAERNKKVFVMDVMNPQLELKVAASQPGTGGA